MSGDSAVFVDLSVYSKNRQLRILGSTKLSKNYPLELGIFTTVTGSNKYVFTNSLASHVPMFIDYVDFEACTVQPAADKLLQLMPSSLTIPKVQKTSSILTAVYSHARAAVNADNVQQGTGTSPYPLLDAYVNIKIRQVSSNGSIRCV